MRAYLKFVTVLLMSVANWFVYLRFANVVYSDLVAVALLALGAATSKLLIDLAIEILTDHLMSTKTGLDVETKMDIGTERMFDAANYASSPILEERQFWNPNANGGQGREETHLVPKGKLYPQMKITPDIEEALIKAAQQSLDNMGTPVWDNIRIRGEWVDFMQGSHLTLSIPKTALEELLNPKRTVNVVADPTLPPGTARMINTETGEVLGTITNIKLEDK